MTSYADRVFYLMIRAFTLHMGLTIGDDVLQFAPH